ncbi:MAG: TetR/AcrR family transcriptional regulator [Eubacteriales bacterium]
MDDTKERILLTALHLFAQDGYEAVPVSRIAGELGMTKGALYKHYKNKRDIFDSIVARMIQIDAQRSREYEVPQNKLEEEPQAYEHVSMESIRKFTAAQFSFWSEDAFASDFRKMLTLEQYRSAEMAELYRSCITSGPVAYMEDIFRNMIKKGILREADPRQLAVEFYAPLYLLVSISDGAADKKEAVGLLEHHIERFMQHNAAGNCREE